MDQMDDKTQKRIFNQKQFMKRTLQFVISVSLFSIFFWCSSGFSGSIHPQSFNAYFSTCLFSMSTPTLERKYMFLICNGILAFLAKNCSSAPLSSDSDHFDHQLHASNLSETCKAPVSSVDMVVVPLGSFESPEKVPLVAETEEEQGEWQEEYYCEKVSSEAEEQEEGTLYTQNEACTAEEEEFKLKGIDEEGGTESEVVKVAQDDDDELAETTMTTNEELANTDELNRKFEEFIRKMKEEMRIEAQRQLIAV